MAEPNKEERIGKLILFLGVIFMLWLISIAIVNCYFPDLGNRGLFGDSFGGINSLFSGLAFGGIIYTILLQRKELKFQREELELTRKELERSANAQEQSGIALNRQAENLKKSAELNAIASLLEVKMFEIENIDKNLGTIAQMDFHAKEIRLQTLKDDIKNLENRLTEVTEIKSS